MWLVVQPCQSDRKKTAREGVSTASSALSKLPASSFAAFLLAASVGAVRKNRGSTATFFRLAGSHSSRFTCSVQSVQIVREGYWKDVAASASHASGGITSVGEGV